MVDDRNDACIIHPRVLTQMKLKDKIVLRCITLTVFSNAVERTSGEITLPVLAGGVNLETKFHIMDQDIAYNAIVGRPWIHPMKVVPSSLYQVIKFPTSWGIFSILGEQRTSRECYRIALDNTTTQQRKDKEKEALQSAGSSHADMPGIPKETATHKLNIDPFHPLMRRFRHKFNSSINDAVCDEVEKLLENGSIMESKYPKWITNMVMVKKKNRKWRMCIDFIDLDKACPKNSFPLPRIDELIEAMAGHELLSFLEAY
ncbi:PREDICTED: uncharacterized protein LOC109230132 [Nicotiana attenuata]|uniref:uncharacterized protein LOC109230132 n=1 Tax=Nicotiana attenuata TaxID=49451 RepID=UPI000904CD57|nr:PREDICTED: uncharacterized protein LOC109230132 [Nicotiana attenuata]